MMQRHRRAIVMFLAGMFGIFTIISISILLRSIFLITGTLLFIVGWET